MQIKDDEIKDLRQKCLKLELEVKEKNQRELEVKIGLIQLHQLIFLKRCDDFEIVLDISLRLFSVLR
jgi:hypothetical protein